MDGQDANTNPQPSNLSNKSLPVLRWLGGGAIGCFSGLLLLGITLALGPAPLGMILIGQFLFFEGFFDSFLSLFRIAISSEVLFLTSVLVYSIVWGIIGALLGSGRKKQVMIGIVIPILYVAVGLFGLWLYGSTMFPT